MTIFEALILGVVEGITEFLPISSTGHLILASSALGIADSEFLKTFEIAIQLGAILSVVALYWRSFLNIEILKRILVAFIPTGIIGLALYGTIKTHLLGNEAVVLWALALGGVALIVFELVHKEKEGASDNLEHVTYKQAAFVGLFQSIAIIPGVSRSAATIVGGLLLGIKRVAIVEFSFLLAVPTMGAATGLDLLQNADSFTSQQTLVLAIGFVTSFVVALGAIKFLLAFVRNHSFIPFGVYRIALAGIFFLWVL
ncbi:undecaprenyl-diphosphatase [Candidatus Kaiserbacteria bacterium CG10_big_fil_rev_8_21_14_0_10_51_14]|uniref:Undecaprenyl-diphosphatase n=1 Tax=Candidatus Kaiserbacteria bacterium CG10_big_fil_rev_8_21_14_0_10_51_14 TaxID=1974610 RepID=A0A2H0UD70_9BACT|nr:MAG: undecaprenyl-diphosphatase [Candidatus Kaiserbacteria bacterium CG10_big_fil_rev_8_21_14_0_10_51_14]